MAPLFIPSPPFSSIHLGPLTIHIYALCILGGIVFAWWAGSRRFVARGGIREQYENMAAVGVVAGIVGARLYHVATDHQLYFGPGRNPWNVFKTWGGGLGVWGAVAGGALAVWFMARRYRLPFGDVADTIGPGILIAQAIGRLGNWFNQELFGRPTTVAWALKIDPEYRPAGYTQYTTFHPTFLYELLWCVFAYGVLLWLERRFRLGRGKVFALYVVLYTFGRFFVERLRIDPAHHYGGMRLNDYTSIIVGGTALLVFLALVKWRPGRSERPFANDAAGTGDQTAESTESDDQPDDDPSSDSDTSAQDAGDDTSTADEDDVSAH